MNKKKVILMGVAILAMLFFVTEPASARLKWYYCTIETIETASDGSVVLSLYREDKDRSRIFTVPFGEENRMLAVALTAIANGMTVRAHIDWANPKTDIEALMLYSSSS